MRRNAAFFVDQIEKSDVYSRQIFHTKKERKEMKKKSHLEEAFSLLYPDYPHPVSLYKKAELVLNNLNVSLLGEEKAFLVCCDIILRVPFPNEKMEEKTRIVGRAENLLPEILGTNPDHEVHMDEVAYWEMRYCESENFENFLKNIK